MNKETLLKYPSVYAIDLEILDAVQQGGTGGGLPDAPKDGTLYGRKDGKWTKVEGGSGDGYEKVAGIDITSEPDGEGGEYRNIINTNGNPHGDFAAGIATDGQSANVGATYTTDDGLTHTDALVNVNETEARMSVAFSQDMGADGQITNDVQLVADGDGARIYINGQELTPGGGGDERVRQGYITFTEYPYNLPVEYWEDGVVVYNVIEEIFYVGMLGSEGDFKWQPKELHVGEDWDSGKDNGILREILAYKPELIHLFDIYGDDFAGGPARLFYKDGSVNEGGRATFVGVNSDAICFFRIDLERSDLTTKYIPGEGSEAYLKVGLNGDVLEGDAYNLERCINEGPYSYYNKKLFAFRVVENADEEWHYFGQLVGGSLASNGHMDLYFEIYIGTTKYLGIYNCNGDEGTITKVSFGPVA